MAVTSIWSVKGWLGKVVIYVENPNKTTNPLYYEQQGLTAEQTQNLSDVISYATQNSKTQLLDPQHEILQRFVTGINCHPATARDEMIAAKKKFGKENGVVAYHGYQSFAPGEVTPDVAHEIGIKLAQKLWGDKYQVIVATHIDKGNHIHSHFVVNSVSWIDGIRYHRTEEDYYAMRTESDRLCMEYRLSVIHQPKSGKAQHYAEWKAQRNGQPTWRQLVKSDIDTALSQSTTERQFWSRLRVMGYEIKMGKDISLRPPGKERFFRLTRNFGEKYSIEHIRKKILDPTPTKKPVPLSTPFPKRYRKSGIKIRQMTGLRVLYYAYLYRMGVLPKKRRPSPKHVYFLYREDIRYMQSIDREMRVLVKHSINTLDQLARHKDHLTEEMALLIRQRKRLRYKLRYRQTKDVGHQAATKADIMSLSKQIKKLRQEIRLCENISIRSTDMKSKCEKENLSKTQEDEKSIRITDRNRQ